VQRADVVEITVNPARCACTLLLDEPAGWSQSRSLPPLRSVSAGSQICRVAVWRHAHHAARKRTLGAEFSPKRSPKSPMNLVGF